MSVLAWLAAAFGALALLLVLPPRPRLSSGAETERVLDAGEGRPLLHRARGPVCSVVAAGVWAFLGGLVGVAAGAAAAVVVWRVLGGIESAAVLNRRERLRADLPGAVDLLVTVLEAGAAPAQGLGLVGDALGGPVAEELGAIRHRIALGADPVAVWREVAAHPELGPLGRALDRAARSGASVSAAGRRLADELRERRGAEVEARARSVSTKAAAPLGACFLPAFVLLGIVPLVAGLVGGLVLLG
ncbi:hypothetical protein GCM10011519_24370 [Marmoricola endophyticus]|uniref:Type II secretion system protein GspF domain-containing protein n=1 Tax=Marmoricola endophyticus TaxID=2040280 RepID=A0A917F5A7_9ACTN|nr:type II secretion system F family protein [Marmoricola endophyticus]GGF49558.1 hypothetical protein GCM10011519_24370 [Marmoricola endophyticus]